MKAKRSRHPGHEVFDLTARDVALLADPEYAPAAVSTVAEVGSAFRAQLAERANRQTHLLEEILSRSQFLTSFELKPAKPDREGDKSQ